MAEEARSKRWRGILAGEQAVVRHAVAIVLFALAASMPFGSLGFWPVADAHVLVSLVPVALAALLFGKWRGCAVGAVAGLAEMAHSIFQPYDYYEKYFAMPLNSVVLLALFGFVLGALFACACRIPRNGDSTATGNPSSGAARIIAIAASAVAGSIFFTVLLQGGMVFANTAFAQYIPADIAVRAYNAEGAIGQICLHAALCALPCAITDWAVGRFGQTVHKLRVRSAFQIWLGALTVGFFFVASAAAYTSLTYLSIANMNVALSDQIDSLAADLRQRDGIVNTLNERGVLQRDELEAFASQQYRRIDCDLAGWLQDTTVLAENGRVFASNNEAVVGSSVADLVAPGTGDAVISKALESDRAVECYQGSGYEISYLRAIEMSYERLGETGVYQIATIVPAKETFLNRPLYMYIVAAVFAALLGTIIFVLMGLLRRVVTRPVDAANEALGRITAGELDQRVPDAASAEFSSLAEGINTTVGALEDSIAEANARIDRELAAARAIQEGALPTARPPFPDINAFDLYATMDPAREVGGDFYDYFDLGARGIGFVVADVSGKGMPAALFMMAAKTAIRGAMEAKANLAEAIRIANRSLCEGNDSEMFVTAFAGIFDWRSGKLTFVNAGHNKPLMLHDGTWTWLKERSGPYLGLFDWIEYKQFEMQMEPGDELFAYTDGVNEAFSAAGKQYGNDRLEAFLSSHAELHPRRLLRAMRADLIGWAIGAEQSDDITMLALKYGIPPEHGESLITTATLDNFEQVTDFVMQHLEEAGCPPKPSNHVLIAVEELVVNVCSYAYPDAPPDKPGPLRVHVTWLNDPNAIVIEIGDDGVPFNPLEKDDPARPASIEEAKIGGLGLMMTRKLMDEIEYVREGIANVTVITKRWE
ncbi:MAG: SpoIIE family protein phosphatase [Eggerthellaceae bacterium]|nr:SpoIIE family protein phosphatase [Eggerthellaceae bacterium]